MVICRRCGASAKLVDVYECHYGSIYYCKAVFQCPRCGEKFIEDAYPWRE